MREKIGLQEVYINLWFNKTCTNLHTQIHASNYCLFIWFVFTRNLLCEKTKSTRYAVWHSLHWCRLWHVTKRTKFEKKNRTQAARERKRYRERGSTAFHTQFTSRNAIEERRIKTMKKKTNGKSYVRLWLRLRTLGFIFVFVSCFGRMVIDYQCFNIEHQRSITLAGMLCTCSILYLHSLNPQFFCRCWDNANTSFQQTTEQSGSRFF